MESEPGYYNYYLDGMGAHNKGVTRNDGPCNRNDPKISIAWKRGWDKAYGCK